MAARYGHHQLQFTDLPKVLPVGTQLWVNNTRVIRARLLLQKPTGGRLEVFLPNHTKCPWSKRLLQRSRWCGNAWSKGEAVDSR